MKKATLSQYLQIGAMIDSGAISRELAQAIIEGRITVSDKPEAPAVTVSESVIVPILSCADLVAHMRRLVEPAYLNPEIADWDFIQDEQGKQYEVLTHRFNRDVSSDEVRAFFKEKGFEGNTAAFIAWIAEHKPQVYSVSIPEDDRLFRDSTSGDLYTPYFNWDNGYCGLNLNTVEGDWGDDCMFVAFRVVSS